MQEEYAETIRVYEDALLGKVTFKLHGPSNLEKESDVMETGNDKLRKEWEKRVKEYKERHALAVIAYAITGILRWTPQEAIESLTDDIMRQLLLDKVASYVKNPKDGVSSSNYGWLVAMAFPDDVAFDAAEQALSVYKKVRSGEFSRYPARFFDGDDGFVKLGVLLKHYIAENIAAASVWELYELFSDTARANTLMHDAMLYSPYHEFYDTPLEYLHDALGADGDDFLFDYYQYMNAYEEVEKELEEAQKARKRALSAQSA